MISVYYKIPSYGMTEYEYLIDIPDMEHINQYPRLKKYPTNCLGIQYKFIDKEHNIELFKSASGISYRSIDKEWEARIQD